MPSGLKILDRRVGTGRVAERGHTAIVQYRGFLNRGEQFRSSYDDGAPVEFRIGRRDVIAGLDKGVVGMRVGGLRELRVSPHLAYRDQEVPGVPANAVLRLEVELLELRGEA
jgi:peptidylprolyl isomerase